MFNISLFASTEPAKFNYMFASADVSFEPSFKAVLKINIHLLLIDFTCCVKECCSPHVLMSGKFCTLCLSHMLAVVSCGETDMSVYLPAELYNGTSTVPLQSCSELSKLLLLFRFFSHSYFQSDYLWFTCQNMGRRFRFLLILFYNCIAPLGFLPWEIRVAFSG